MPRVPVLDTPQVASSTLSNMRLNVPTIAAPIARTVDVPDAMPDVAGRQAQQMGVALQSIGGVLGRRAAELTQQVNQTRIDDAMNRLVKTDTDLQAQALQLLGRNALERPDGKALPDEYGEKLQSTMDEIRDGLGNDAQKLAFQQQAGRIKGQLYGRLTNHIILQQQVFADESSQARMATAIDRVGMLPDDEEAFHQSLAAIRTTVDERVARNGGNQEMADVEYRKVADQAYYTRYKSWAQTDPMAALSNFQASRGHVSPLTRDRISDDLFRTAAPQLVNAAKPWVTSAGAAPAGRPELANEPRGVRNNNPGNIRQSGTPWQGEVSGNDPAYATFATPEAGIRAMGKNLLTYQDAYDLDTVTGIVSRWAPATDNNDTAAYAVIVAKALGVKPDDKLDLHDPDTMGKMVRAMIGVENGKQPYSDALITTGVNAALGKGALPASADVGAALPVPAWRDPESKTGIAFVDNLPPDQKARVLSVAQSQTHQDMSVVRDSLQTRVQDTKAEYLTSGTATNPPSESEMIRAYGQIEGVKRYRDLQDTATLGVELQRTKVASNADLLKMLADEKPDSGEGFAGRQRNYEILQKAVQQTIETRRKDPIAFAMQNPAFAFKPITDFANGQPVAEELSKRRESMGRVAGDYGTPPAVLTNKEAEAFGQYVATLEVPDKARVLGVVATAAGGAGMESISRQLHDKDNSLAVAAMLAGRRETITHWWGLGADTQGPDTALLYLQGRDALAQKRALIDDAAETGIKAQIYQAIDGVYQTPQGRDAAAQAAFGIYAGLKAQGTDDVRRAVRIATGGVMDYNGGKIAKPYGWDDSRFEDAMSDSIPKTIREAGGRYQVGGVKLTADELADKLPAARLRSARDTGTYLVIVGDDLVRLPDGAPFVLTVQ